MTDTPFNTLGTMRQLEARGFTSEQAEAVTEAIRSGVTGGVATKADLAQLETELKTELKWIKRIGGGIVALLAVPLLRDLIETLGGTAP